MWQAKRRTAEKESEGKRRLKLCLHSYNWIICHAGLKSSLRRELHWITFIATRKSQSLWSFQFDCSRERGRIRLRQYRLGVYTEQVCLLGIISHSLISHRPIKLYMNSVTEKLNLSAHSPHYTSILIIYHLKWEVSDTYFDLNIKTIRDAPGDTRKHPPRLSTPTRQ